jgi:hypothetical protein
MRSDTEKLNHSEINFSDASLLTTDPTWIYFGF